MVLQNEKEIKVIRENLPKEFLDYVLAKDDKHQLLSVSFNKDIMLLEYQHARIKENLTKPQDRVRFHKQFKSKKQYLSRSVGNYGSNEHVVVKCIKDGMYSTFILPKTISGKHKKEVLLDKDKKLVLTYTGNKRKTILSDNNGKYSKGTSVPHYKAYIDDIFNICLSDIFKEDSCETFEIITI